MAARHPAPWRSLAALLAALACLPGGLLAQDAPAPKGEQEAKPAKDEEGGSTLALDPELRKLAMDNAEIAPLLALRAQLDKVYAEYRSLALAKGLRAQKRASRRLGTLGSQAEKGRDKLAGLVERQLEPLTKELEKDKAREEKLLRRLDKVGEKGRDRDVKEMQRELDALRTAIGEAESLLDVLGEIGRPSWDVLPPEVMLLQELVKPNEQEERALLALVKQQRGLVEGRVLLIHLQADLQAARQGTAENPADPDRARGIERQLAQVEKKFAKYFMGVWGPIAERERELLEERDETERKAVALAGRSSAKKHELKLAELEAKLDSGKRTYGIYERIANGTLAAKEFAESRKPADEGDKEDREGKGRRRDRRKDKR